SAERRGAAVNSFEHRLGERATGDLFDGIEMGWRRIPGGERVTLLLERAQRSYDPDRPEAVVPALLELRTALAAPPDDPIVRRKREALDALIRAASGLWLEAIADRHSVTPGGTLRVALSALVRTGVEVRVTGIALQIAGTDSARTVATRGP